MNIIVASSRGKGMELLADPPYNYIRVRSGEKILDLAEVAIKIISDNYHRIDPADPICVYFLAGLPDTTSMIKQFYRLNGMNCCYQEVTFPESPDQAYLRITDIIQAASDRIKSFHAIPVFATYAPSSLSVWNRTRLLQHKTSHLNHFSQYPTMQENLITTIDRINNQIFAIYSKENVITPNLAELIVYKRQSALRVRYGKLKDGVHVNSKVKNAWITILTNIMAKNELNFHSSVPAIPPTLPLPSSSESDSDIEEKRNWLY